MRANNDDESIPRVATSDMRLAEVEGIGDQEAASGIAQGVRPSYLRIGDRVEWNGIGRK